jgi:hypothetical protein
MVFQIIVLLSIRILFSGLYRRCECDCGYLIPCINKHGRFARFRKGHYKERRGQNSSSYKNGKYSDNYLKIIINGKNIKKHIHIFEQYHQCCMLKWGVVHHTDKNKRNNNIENLEGMTVSEHMFLHHIKDMSYRFCKICGGKTTYKKTKRGTLCELWFGNDIDGWTCNNCYMRQIHYKYRNGQKGR